MGETWLLSIVPSVTQVVTISWYLKEVGFKQHQRKFREGKDSGGTRKFKV